MDAIEYVSDQDQHAGLILKVNDGYIAIDDQDQLIWPVLRNQFDPCFPSARDARSVIMRRFNDHQRVRRGLRDQRHAVQGRRDETPVADEDLFSTTQVGVWSVRRYHQEPLRARGAPCYVCASLGRPSNQDPILIVATAGEATQMGGPLVRFYHGHCYSITGRGQLAGFVRSPRLA